MTVDRTVFLENMPVIIFIRSLWHLGFGRHFPISSLVKISSTSLIWWFTFNLYLNLLVYNQNIFGSSLKDFSNLWESMVIFGSFRKMFCSIHVIFGQFLENCLKSSESGQKSLENCPKCCHHHVYIHVVKWTLIHCTCSLKDMNFMFQ